MGRVFISYSHKNFDIVSKVNNELRKNHILTWFDNDDIHVNVDIYGKHYIQLCERMYCGTLGVLKDHISEFLE